MSLVRLAHDGAVAVVTLARSERHNTLVPALISGVERCLSDAVNGGARAVVLEAEGRTFSTGGDVKAMRAAPDRFAYCDELVGGLNRLLLTMIDLPIPIVAAVHGMVTGGSMGLVAASDIVVVEPKVTFRSWYATVGFAPDGGWIAILPRLIGAGRVRRLLLADEEFTAAEAAEWGLAHRVVAAGTVDAEARELASRMARLQAGTIGAIKRLLAQRDEIAAGLDAEKAAFLELVVTEEATAGMDAFLGSNWRRATGDEADTQ